MKYHRKVLSNDVIISVLISQKFQITVNIVLVSDRFEKKLVSTERWSLCSLSVPQYTAILTGNDGLDACISMTPEVLTVCHVAF